MERTIAAISTPPGTGGISVIRVSGERAIEICDSIFSGNIVSAKTHTVHYGYILDGEGNKIDEVLVTLMRAPRTFTREDVVEISTHGGMAAPGAVLDALIKAGAYHAEPGEFTKRAFLNGRIDLSQAEAVIDIINSTNDLANRVAMRQLGGALSKEIEDIRKKLIHTLARMQVIIDYPDEDLEDITQEEMLSIAKASLSEVERLLKTADSGKVLRDGIRTVIVGKPNVGKSSLLNKISRLDRAIVTNIAGTTRDVIEEYVNFNGIPVILVDTAGIRATDNQVERIGVEKSLSSIESADFVIVMIDGSSFFDDEDLEVLRATKDKKRIILINKTDLGQSKYIDAIKGRSGGSKVIEISAKTGLGVNSIGEEIRKLFELGEISTTNGTVITNGRHKEALLAAKDDLQSAVEGLVSGLPGDFAAFDFSNAVEALGKITGETVTEDVVEEIFHNFCVGK